MTELSNSEIGLYFAALFTSYFAGLKVGKIIRIVKDLGNAA